MRDLLPLPPILPPEMQALLMRILRAEIERLPLVHRTSA